MPVALCHDLWLVDVCVSTRQPTGLDSSPEGPLAPLPKQVHRELPSRDVARTGQALRSQALVLSFLRRPPDPLTYHSDSKWSPLFGKQPLEIAGRVWAPSKKTKSPTLSSLFGFPVLLEGGRGQKVGKEGRWVFSSSRRGRDMFSLLHSARPCRQAESEVADFFFYLTLSAYKWYAVFTGNLWLDPLSIPTMKELWWPDYSFSILSAVPRPHPRSLTVIKQGIIELEREDICLKRRGE